MYLCNKSHVKQCNKISAVRNKNQPYMTVGTPTVFTDKKKEITKISKCIKANKAEPFFKCLKCSIFSAKTFGIDILQSIKQPKLLSCQSQTENHISHSSTTDQSNQIHSS